MTTTSTGQRQDTTRHGYQTRYPDANGLPGGLEAALRGAATASRDVVADARSPKVWTRGVPVDDVAALLGVSPGHIDSSAPAVGLWTLVDRRDGRPALALECHPQGRVPHLVERWYKSAAVYRALDAQIYLSICVGDGFFDRNSAQIILETAVACDPDERARLAADTVWNSPVGRIRLYRYRTEAEAAASVGTVIAAIVAELFSPR